MKKALVSAIMVMLVLSAAVLAGPFARVDLTLPDTGSAFIGLEAGDLVIQFGVVDLLDTPGLSMSTWLYQSFEDNRIEFECGLWIDEIDPITTYPIPIIEDFGVNLAGILHLSNIFADELTTSTTTFDIYAGAKLTYDIDTSQLVPEFRLGVLLGGNIQLLPGNYWRYTDW